MIFWVVQILGIVSLIFYGLSFQMRTKENLLIMQVVSNIFAAIQYLLTMALTGAVQTLLGVMRGIVFYFFKKRNLKPSKTVLVIFEIAIILASVFTWAGMISCLPLAGMTANLYGQWQNDMKVIRTLAVISGILWAVYAFYTGVYTAMLTEMLKVVSSLIGLWRFRKVSETHENIDR
ncbi:MAG: YgjV family protein [Oscillospiraceae bacterium]|nr:YgjV family protein [Oscillospiraceae bacterium]